jgi:hypothetical protein
MRFSNPTFGRAMRRKQPGLGDSGARHPGLQRLAPAARVSQLFGRQHPGQRAAAEQSHQRALLIREINHFHMHR